MPPIFIIFVPFREKMAFFTRVNSNVPFLPTESCHPRPEESETSKGNEVRDNADGGESKQESGRYEYVVDRILGVEV